MSSAESIATSDKKKLQIRETFIKELDSAFCIFGEIEESVELQSVYNIFTLLCKTNPELVIRPFHEDFTIKFYKKTVPEVDVQFFLTYDIETHIRSSITTEYIFNAMIKFCKKMQVKLNIIYNNGTESEKKIVTKLGLVLQKLVKLTNLYNK